VKSSSSVSIQPNAHRAGTKASPRRPWSEVPVKFPVAPLLRPGSQDHEVGAFISWRRYRRHGPRQRPSAPRSHRHPADVAKSRQTVKAQVLAIDKEKRQLSGNEAVGPTGLDEYIVEHKWGCRSPTPDGSSRDSARRIGEGIYASCRISINFSRRNPAPKQSGLSSLTSMLQARWKGGAATSAPKPETVSVTIRNFRTLSRSPDQKIEVELV